MADGEQYASADQSFFLPQSLSRACWREFAWLILYSELAKCKSKAVHPLAAKSSME